MTALGSPAQQPPAVRRVPAFVPVLLAALFVTATAARLLSCAWYPFVHADEYHQYLSPAWWRLTGLGVEAWEWKDGARSWVLPFYNGAWLRLFMDLGITRGSTLVWLLRLQWALCNAALVYVAYRGASLTARGLNAASGGVHADRTGETLAGLLAAATCALFAPLVIYSGHTLTELPSMLCLLFGLVLTHEIVAEEDVRGSGRRAITAGLLLSFGACLRITNGPLALIPLVWLLCTRRCAAFGALVSAALLVGVVFGLIDLLTWGRFAHSFILYLEFNLLDGRAAQFGVEPPDWYLRVLQSRAPLGLPVLTALAALGWRRTWPYVISAAGLVAYLSTQAHKEERFSLMVWPCLFIAASATLGHRISLLRQHTRGSDVLQKSLVCAIAGLVLVDAARHVELPNGEARDRMRCEAWAGDQADARGLVLAISWSLAGGALWYGRRIPIVSSHSQALYNPLFNYAIVAQDTEDERMGQRAGYHMVYASGAFRVYKRSRDIMGRPP
jgi:GPI mannosyltransferase 3